MAAARRKQPVGSDQDNIWKEIIELYFNEFLAFFFPDIHRDVDWNKPYEFLDKELEKIARNSSLGKRLADKLVKVYLNDGQETWLLIHIEVQGYADKRFEERMFIYNYRIFDRYRKEVVSVAVLTDAKEGYRPSVYQRSRWRCEQFFRFPTVKLLDYNKDWAALEADQNPFAILVMAHLKVQQLRRSRIEELKAWKFRLVRMLFERGYSRQYVLNLFYFLDWLVKLPDELQKQFEEEVEKYQEGEAMPYMTVWERRGIEKGRQEGRVNLTLQLLNKKLGQLDANLEQRIAQLEVEQLEQLGEMLFDLPNESALIEWLEKNT